MGAHSCSANAKRARWLSCEISFKERQECLYRWRLWAGFGEGWEWTKVKDVIRETLFSRIYRACKEWNSWTGRGQFFARMDLVRQMVILTVEHAWPIGCGPDGVP